MERTTPLGFDRSGSGPVLLCIHGFPLDRTMWRAQREGLADLGAIVAPDLRGRGKSPQPAREKAAWSLDDHADDLAALLDALGAEQADVMGLSMGGYIALALLRRHATRVRSLILVNTKSEADTPEVRANRALTADLVRAQGTTALLPAMLPKLLGPDAKPAVRARVRTMFEDAPGETTSADSLAIGARPDATEMLGSIAVPALVMHGDLDALMPIEGARAMASKIPGARFVAVPGAGHMSPLEAPEVVNNALRSFLLSR